VRPGTKNAFRSDAYACEIKLEIKSAAIIPENAVAKYFTRGLVCVWFIFLIFSADIIKRNIYPLYYLITVLAGGTGSVKLVRGLAKLAKDMTIISNVGDNIWLYGLYVCPDIDTIIYGLAGLLDAKRGWGVKGDSFECMTRLKKLGAPAWFSLGDRDLATHILRTSMIKADKSLSEVTAWMKDRHSISAKVIPATDSEVTTRIMTDRGEMHLQEFWVKHKGMPKVTGIRYDGADKAAASSGAVDAIRHSDVVIIAPANPVSSIGPIVALADLREELAQSRDRVIAISPLIGERAVSGPAVKYMKAIGLESSPTGVARYYRDFAGAFVISKSDHRLASRIESLGMQVYETNITMKSRQDEVRLGQQILSKIKK
jgi:LPPG:FO 2-phospho-L-lactate transferase